MKQFILSIFDKLSLRHFFTVPISTEGPREKVKKKFTKAIVLILLKHRKCPSFEKEKRNTNSCVMIIRQLNVSLRGLAPTFENINFFLYYHIY